MLFTLNHPQMPSRIISHSSQDFRKHACHSAWRFFEPGTFRVFTYSFQDELNPSCDLLKVGFCLVVFCGHCQAFFLRLL